MSQERRRRINPYARPEGEPRPAWAVEMEKDADEETREAFHEAERRESPRWDAETVWDDTPPDGDEMPRGYQTFAGETHEVLSDQLAENLACLCASLFGPLGLFFLCAEHEKRAIRYFAIRSVFLTAVHLLSAAVLYGLNALVGSVPFLGIVITTVLWLSYIILVILLLVIRIRMMFAAWRGTSFRMPLADAWLDEHSSR